MKRVLLYGDYSNVHWTLAQGLRKLEVDVKVASGGDRWKNFKRDIDLSHRKSISSILNFSYKHLLSNDLRGYDVVQLINCYPFRYPNYPKLSNFISKSIINLLKKYNDNLYLGAFGDDFYWVNACLNGCFDHSFLHLYRNSNKMFEEEYSQTVLKLNEEKSYEINKYVAEKSEKIIAGTYDYWLPYNKTNFSDKLNFIPFPVNTDEITYKPNKVKFDKIVFLIGIQRKRYYWKGLDIICPILERMKEKYPNDIELIFVENLPFKEYQEYLSKANVIVDQLYSYGQGMNTLTSMAKGKVVMANTDDGHYSLLASSNKPVISISPTKEDIESKIIYILENRVNIEEWGENSRLFVEDNHCYKSIAKQYCNIWNIL